MIQIKKFLYTEAINVPGVIDYMIILRASIGGENQPIAIEVLNEIRGIEGVVTVKQRAPLKEAPGNKKMILISLTLLESMGISDDDLVTAIKKVKAVDMVIIKEKDGVNKLKGLQSQQQIPQQNPQQSQSQPLQQQNLEQQNQEPKWKQTSLGENLFIRVFNPKNILLNESELEWHRDKKNREIKIIQSGGWKFQLDNHLPMQLRSGQVIKIKAEQFHRVIKGNSDLILLIKEK